MAFRILVSDNLNEKGLQVFRDHGDFEVDVKTGLTPEELIGIIGDYHGLVIRSATTVDAAVIEAGSNLKVVGRAGTGLDNVAIQEATRRGIVIMNTPGGNSEATAEHTISLIMALHRHIPQAVDSLKAGRWDKKKFQGREMAGKTLGIIGLGKIGSIVARLASKGLKMEVLGYDPFLTKQAASLIGVRSASLEEIYAQSDIVTVHTPLTDETRGLIDRDTIAKMKDGVMIVNCARGGIVDEEALLEALESGKAAGAAIDVYTQKPPGEHPLVMHPRVVATPHLGASTHEAQENVAVAVAEQIINYLANGVIENAVNIPAVDAAMAPKVLPYQDLAQRMGSFIAQLAVEGVTAMDMEYLGDMGAWDLKPMTNSALVGLLRPFEGPDVNVVNASVIAGDRGISVSETTREEGDFASSLVIKATFADGSSRTVHGALIKRIGDEPRIIGINGFVTEAVPAGPMLIVTNRDVPGMIRGMTGVLADAGINIAQMNLSRDKSGGTALSILNIDSPAEQATLDAVRSIDGILGVTQVILDD